VERRFHQRLVGEELDVLCPQQRRDEVAAVSQSEVVAVYPHRWAVPRDTWGHFFSQAEREIGALVYSGMFMAEDLGVRRRFINMLRVFRPSSPMNLGTWILSAFGGAVTGASLLSAARGGWRAAGDACAVPAPMSTPPTPKPTATPTTCPRPRSACVPRADSATLPSP